MSKLRSQVIKLAYENPGPIRDALLPLLRVAYQTRKEKKDKFRYWKEVTQKLRSLGIPSEVDSGGGFVSVQTSEEDAGQVEKVLRGLGSGKVWTDELRRPQKGFTHVVFGTAWV